MSARKNDALRLAEILEVISTTLRQVEDLGFDRDRFLSPRTDSDDLVAEGIMSRVFRATEELGYLDEEVLERIGYERREIRGVRNRLAHVYGEVDRAVIWDVVESDFPAMAAAGKAIMEERGWCGQGGAAAGDAAS